MLAAERRNRIVRLLSSTGTVTVSQLSDEFGVTAETIRRDLDILEQENLLRRIHGGAVALQNRQEVPFDIRSETNVEEKRLIAQKAARSVEPGDTLFIDISSTAMFFAKEICKIPDITVITNSLIIALEFIDKKDVTLISTGGTLRPNSYSLVGPLANTAIKNYRADKFFCSCRGFSLDHGVSDSNELENEVKKTMLQQSSKLYLLMDHSKFGETGLAQFANAADIDVLFCDNRLAEEDLRAIKMAGVTVL